MPAVPAAPVTCARRALTSLLVACAQLLWWSQWSGRAGARACQRGPGRYVRWALRRRQGVVLVQHEGSTKPPPGQPLTTTRSLPRPRIAPLHPPCFHCCPPPFHHLPWLPPNRDTGQEFRGVPTTDPAMESVDLTGSASPRPPRGRLATNVMDLTGDDGELEQHCLVGSD